MTNDDLRKQEEFEARNALLQYYSSQSREHVSYLLTMGLLLFGSIQLVLASKPTLRFVGLVLWFFFSVMLRTMFRTLYWGHLAHAIIVADEDKLVPKNFAAGEFEDSQLRIHRLQIAAWNHVLKRHSWAAWFASFWSLEGWLVSGILAGTITGVLIWAYWNLAQYWFFYSFPW
jgi:hypothetical protein